MTKVDRSVGGQKKISIKKHQLRELCLILFIRMNRHTKCSRNKNSFQGDIALPFSLIKINFLLVIFMLHETM